MNKELNPFLALKKYNLKILETMIKWYKYPREKLLAGYQIITGVSEKKAVEHLNILIDNDFIFEVGDLVLIKRDRVAEMCERGEIEELLKELAVCLTIEKRLEFLANGKNHSN